VRSDWVKNIMANPVFKAHVGRRRFKAVAEWVHGPHASDILMRYIDDHRLYTRAVMLTISVDLGAFTDEELRARLEEEKVLAIKPVGEKVACATSFSCERTGDLTPYRPENTDQFTNHGLYSPLKHEQHYDDDPTEQKP